MTDGGGPEHGPGGGQNTTGMTLIELVVAMAIFALVAVMGLQALTGAMRMRDRLTRIDSDTATLGFGIGLLRNDLGAIVPILFRAPGSSPRSAIDLEPGGRVLGLSLAGQPSLPAVPGPGLQRAIWRFDPAAGTLSRSSWPALYPAQTGDQSPEAVVLRDLRGWSIRSHWPQQGWVRGTTGVEPPSAPPKTGADSDAGLSAIPESYSSGLPDAIELTLDSATFGRIVLIESLR